MREVTFPLRLSLGQYLHVLGHLHGVLSICFGFSFMVRVDVRTKLSDRFLLCLSPKVASSKWHLVSGGCHWIYPVSANYSTQCLGLVGLRGYGW